MRAPPPLYVPTPVGCASCCSSFAVHPCHITHASAPHRSFHAHAPQLEQEAAGLGGDVCFAKLAARLASHTPLTSPLLGNMVSARTAPPSVLYLKPCSRVQMKLPVLHLAPALVCAPRARPSVCSALFRFGFETRIDLLAAFVCSCCLAG